MPSATRMRCFVYAGIMLGAAAFAPLAANAAEADDLRADIAAALDEMLASPDNAVTYEAVDVQGAAAPYDVTIRGIKVSHEPDKQATIGDISFKVAPAGERMYDVSDLKLPSSISIPDEETGAPATVTLGSQSFQGRWSAALQTFLTMEGSFGDLKATDGTGKTVFSVAGLQLHGDSKEASPGHWDQDATVKLTDLAGGDDEGRVTIGEIEASSQVHGLDLAAFETLMKQIEAISQEAAKTPMDMPPMDTPPPSEDQGGALAPDNGANPPAPETPTPENDAGAALDSDNAMPAQESDGTAQGSDSATTATPEAENATPAPQAESGTSESAAEGNVAAEGSTSTNEGTGAETQGDLGVTQPEEGTEAGPDENAAGTGTGQGDNTGMDAAAAAQAAAAEHMLQALRDLPVLLGDTVSQLTIRGISFKDGSGAEKFSLGEGGLEIGLTGLDQEKSGFRFAYRHLALKGDWAKLNQAESASGEPVDAQSQALMDKLIPGDLVIDIRLEDLPGKQLWQSFLQTVGSEATSPSMPGMGPDIGAASAFFGMSAVATLQQAGSKLRLVDSRIVNQVASAKLDGTVAADPASPMGASGALNMEVTGLDDLISLVKANMVGPEAAQQVAPLELLRAFGDRHTESDGRVVDRYVLSLDKSGAILLNGKDFQFLLGAMGGGAPGGDEMPMPEPGQDGQDMQDQPMEQPGEAPAEEPAQQ